jgi:hypothetical protein
MRSTAVIAMLLSASALTAGCLGSDEAASSVAPPIEAAQPDDVDVVAAAAFPSTEQVGSCVEQVKFGAFVGDASWTQVWTDVGKTDAGASAFCAQLGIDNAAELARVHEDWLGLQALAAASATESTTPPADADTPEAPPVTTERQPEIPPFGPDLNCGDIGRRVWVGSNDYHELDANGDGWGCDSYG